MIVQQFIDADVSGVMFTPDALRADTVIEAAPGLGVAVVDGRVTPDRFHISPADVVTADIAAQTIRLDRIDSTIVESPIPPDDQPRAAVTENAARAIAAAGARVAEILGSARDIEWAVDRRGFWILQARPITAAVETPNGKPGPPADHVLTGTPGSSGAAMGTARVVTGPRDFSRVRPGDIIICRFTDPAWTPLLRIAGAVVTEVGGVLSHAAIVAREYGIPAVLGVSAASTRIRSGVRLAVDATRGTVTIHSFDERHSFAEYQE